MAYEAIKTFENGTREEKEFNDYVEMVHWLAESPDAGIVAYEDGDLLDQKKLGDDIEYYG
jgi:hypothetical protein